MKSRTAVALEAGKPLQIVEADAALRKAHEALARITRTGVCHTVAFTLSGDGPKGVFTAILRYEGAGQEYSTRPFQLVPGRRWLGAASGRVKGRSEPPGMMEDAMTGKIKLVPLRGTPCR